MGKTTLVREFLRGVPRALYFFVTRKGAEDLRAEFAERLAAVQPAFRGARLTWDGLSRACFDAAQDTPFTKAHYGAFTIGRVSPASRAEAKTLDIALWEL